MNLLNVYIRHYNDLICVVLSESRIIADLSDDADFKNFVSAHSTDACTPSVIDRTL